MVLESDNAPLLQHSNGPRDHVEDAPRVRRGAAPPADARVTPRTPLGDVMASDGGEGQHDALPICSLDKSAEDLSNEQIGSLGHGQLHRRRVAVGRGLGATWLLA